MLPVGILISALLAVPTGGRTPSSDISTNTVKATGTTTPRAIKDHFADVVNVKAFGAKGDGATNDTAAILAALSVGRNVYFPPGTYLSDPFNITGTLHPVTGLLEGKRIFGAGPSATILKARSAGDQFIFLGNPDYAIDGKWSVHNVVEDLTIDGEGAIPNTTGNALLYLYGTYNNRISNVRFGVWDLPRARWDLSVGRGVYTTVIDSCHGHQLQLASDTIDRVTTITVTGGSWTFINISKALAITFVGTAIQGAYEQLYSRNRIQIADSYNVSFVGGDLEGNGNVFVVAGSSGVEVANNNVAVTGSYTDPSGLNTTASVFIYAENSTQVRSRGNVFMNWTAGPSSPTPGTYFSNAGGNSRFSLEDVVAGRRPEPIGTPISADRGDTSQTLTAGVDEQVQRWATTLTANRTITLSTTGAAAGDTFRVVRTGLGAFTLDVGGLKTIPSATAAFVDVTYDGSAWRLTGYGAL